MRSVGAVSPGLEKKPIECSALRFWRASITGLPGLRPLFQHPVSLMSPEKSSVTPGQLRHDRFAGSRALEAEHRAGEVEPFLNGPDGLVIVGREDPGRIAHR